MREQQAGQNERAGEPADDHVHFHTFCFVFLMETGCKQPAENRPVNYGDDGIAGERTSAGWATHKHIPTKAKATPNDNSNDDAQNHGVSHFQVVMAAFGALSSHALNWRGPENPTT